MNPPSPGLARTLALFARRNWSPFPFQRDAWNAYARGASGLIHAATGHGKTLAALLGPAIECIDEQQGTLWCQGAEAAGSAQTGSAPRRASGAAARAALRRAADPLRVLWITPLRALAADTTQGLLEAAQGLGLNWTVERRTGDTPGGLRRQQRERWPTVLVTTPESLSVMLSYPETRERFATLRAVIVDEWHELLGTKRGVQTELCLARLRAFNPALRTWGLSATLGNLHEAMDALLGGPPPGAIEHPRELVAGQEAREVELHTLIPASSVRFPWAGHIGLGLLPGVIQAIEGARTSLVFTNTRSQAEIWFRAIIEARPDWIGLVGLHHGSIDAAIRARVEDGLRAGTLRGVVCTSSLDLGVDFSPVDQVIQIGSPKGIARLLQRAGRSGHSPGRPSRIIGVPTHAMELLEFAAARTAMRARRLEARAPLSQPLDVLAQHMVTVACAEGFDPVELLAEVRTAHAYRDLSAQEWEWAIDFVTRGGPALAAYPQYARLVVRNGRLVPAEVRTERLHRLGIGTITSEAAMSVRLISGKMLGTIEENFVSRLRAGDRFVFAGRTLELVRLRDMTTQVRLARRGRGAVPRWDGGKMPLSTQLSREVRELMHRCAHGRGAGVPLLDPSRRDGQGVRGEHAQRRDECTASEDADGRDARPTKQNDACSTDPGERQWSAEVVASLPLLELQARWSHVPSPDELLVETMTQREGHHLFLYPFEGRLVHEGLAALLAHRAARASPRTITATATDYGVELLSPTPWEADERTMRELLSIENLTDDLLACMNSVELARRQFRDIARIAGLIVPGFPGAGGAHRSARHLQASSGLFFDVLREFDPASMLLAQARREVLDSMLEVSRLRDTLERLATSTIMFRELSRLSPLAFPLWAEQLRSQSVSSETWSQRVQRMAVELERRADAPRAGVQVPARAARARGAGRGSS